MTRQDDSRSSSDKFLDLLLDALIERQKARRAQAVQRTADQKTATPEPQPKPTPPPIAPTADNRATREAEESRPQPGDDAWEPPARVPSIQLNKTVSRLLLLIIILALAVNIPLNRYGVSLARMMPDAASLVIRDGLLLKGEGPEVYVMQDDTLRWISSLDAFERLGYHWDDVHAVENSFLEQFEQGTPIHILMKCDTSPHVYRIEGNTRRWIKDIETFEAKGHAWSDVWMVDCWYLSSIPLGLPIPEDAGTPPHP